MQNPALLPLTFHDSPSLHSHLEGMLGKQLGWDPEGAHGPDPTLAGLGSCQGHHFVSSGLFILFKKYYLFCIRTLKLGTIGF